jgi:hypothetical protein
LTGSSLSEIADLSGFWPPDGSAEADESGSMATMIASRMFRISAFYRGRSGFAT